MVHLINPTSIMLRKAYPWAFSVQKILRASQPFRFSTSHLMFGSDFSGAHKASKYKVYCFLIAEEKESAWMTGRLKVRREYLRDGRRMSFKRLNDVRRRNALVPFLQAANALNGHLVSVLIHKSFRHLSTSPNPERNWPKKLGLKSVWRPDAFEDMARKAHIFSLCVAEWSQAGADVTWITDEDEFVANEVRLDDAQRFAARLSSQYLDHPLRVFAMNSTAIDGEGREFEDFVAIPDLAAGMLAELCSKLSSLINWKEIPGRYPIFEQDLSLKSQIIMDWFWFRGAPLRRTCIVIDKVDGGGRVFKLDQSPEVFP